MVDFSSGEIFDSKDNRSGQVDIIIQSKSDPRIHIQGNEFIVLLDTVIAVLEVKSTLTTGKTGTLQNALRTIQKVKQLERKVLIDTKDCEKRKPHHATPSFIIAYNGPNAETLVKDIELFYGDSPKKEWPDHIVVLKQGYYLTKDNGWVHNMENPSTMPYFLEQRSEYSLCALFVYLCELIQHWDNKRVDYAHYTDYINPLA